MKYYTKQYCSICKKTIKIDALDFLMNLDKKIICDECKKRKEENIKECKGYDGVTGWRDEG